VRGERRERDRDRFAFAAAVRQREREKRAHRVVELVGLPAELGRQQRRRLSRLADVPQRAA
jgi:hypothetical protein